MIRNFSAIDTNRGWSIYTTGENFSKKNDPPREHQSRFPLTVNEDVILITTTLTTPQSKDVPWDTLPIPPLALGPECPVEEEKWTAQEGGRAGIPGAPELF